MRRSGRTWASVVVVLLLAAAGTLSIVRPAAAQTPRELPNPAILLPVMSTPPLPAPELPALELPAPAPRPAQLPPPQAPAPELPAPKEVRTGLSLEQLAEVAAANHPDLVVARARLQAAQGKYVQAGLYPNPIFGLRQDEWGHSDPIGHPGFILTQDFVTARKL